MKRTCKQCGKEFVISGSEINFYKSKNLSIPKRCKECRDSNKGKNNKSDKKSENNNITNTNTNINNGKPQTNQKNDTSQKVEQIITTVSEKSGIKLPKWLIGGAVVVIGVVGGALGLSGMGNDPNDTSSQSVSVTTVAEQTTTYEETKAEETKTEEITEKETEKASVTEVTEKPEADYDSQTAYEFRNSDLLISHYEKHGIGMGFASAEEYEDAASDVVNSEDALYKTEKEDGDHVYYIEETNEIVVVSVDGYIRTYFNPDDGIEYFERQ